MRDVMLAQDCFTQLTNRFRRRNAEKQPTRNIGGKKRVRWEDVDSDYLFGNAQSGKWYFLLLVLVLPDGRHVTISIYRGTSK